MTPSSSSSSSHSLKSNPEVVDNLLHHVNLLQNGSLQPSHEIYHHLLKKCTQFHRPDKGRIIHTHLLNSTFRNNTVIHNSLLNMYAKCASLPETLTCFHKIPSKNIVSWTTLISAYSQKGMHHHALLLFPQMLRAGFVPNPFTFSTLLKSSAFSTIHGRQLHAFSLKSGHHSSVYVASSILYMYSKNGLIQEANSFFDQLLYRNEVSWNALIAGNTIKNGVTFFGKMLKENLRPTPFTFSTIFSSCASMGALEQGKWVHGYMVKYGGELHSFVGNTLLNMYAKSGSIDDARRVFHRLVKRDMVSWNSMLSGLAQHGLGAEAIFLFETMMEKKGVDIIPNEVSFLCVLTACSHAGLIPEGKLYFQMMKRKGIEPGAQHYATMVGLLGRGKNFSEALRLIEEMKVAPTGSVWGALLGACVVHKMVEMGAYAAEKVMELEPYDSGAYILISNLYASVGRWEEVGEWRKMMKRKGVRKEPGWSWVEVENVVHLFMACDDSHPRIEEIRGKWRDLCEKIKEIGYEMDRRNVCLDEEEEEERRLQFHSEKLALAFAVLSLPGGCVIRIKKNIRVCGDCHSAFKYVSKVLGREIVLRDRNRFHHFLHGLCSCRDYW